MMISFTNIKMINRLFFFIRKDIATPFYHETTNYFELIRQHLFAIHPGITLSHGVINEKIHYYKFSHPTIDEFKLVTQNMYFNGDLKQEFKKCMRYTKDHKVAFALSAVRSEIPDGTIQRLQYYNIKTSDKNFIDATYAQKVALGLYDATVNLEELVFTINFFDYEHNIKQVETRLVNTNDVWAKLREAQRITCPDFMTEKSEFNAMHNIIEGKSSEINDRPILEYAPTEVVTYLDDSLKTVVLDLGI